MLQENKRKTQEAHIFHKEIFLWIYFSLSADTDFTCQLFTNKNSDDSLTVFLCRMTWLPFTTLPLWEKEEHAAIWQRSWWICCWKEKSSQAMMTRVWLASEERGRDFVKTGFPAVCCLCWSLIKAAINECPQSRQKSLNSALPLTGCMSCTYSLRFQMKPLLGPKRVVVIPLLLTRICPFHFPCHKILNNAFFKPMFSTTFKYKIWEVWC